MSQVESLLAEYIEEHRSGGEADPARYLDRAAPRDRRELAALLDAYLARAPRRPFDESTFRGSATEATVDALQRSLVGESGLWPVLLPRLRARAGLKRRELVERLADTLGVGPGKPKVERYYHEMEQGLLPAEGVSDQVLDALASLIGSTRSALREAGESIGASPESPGAVQAFARATAFEPSADLPVTASASAEERRDEVDDLFHGGP